MKTRSTILALFFLVFGAVTSIAQSASLALIPASIALPLLVREATGNRVVQPDCNMQMVVANKNNFVCANSGIDWSSYGSVKVISVEVAPMHLKKPLNEIEVEMLKATLTDSLRREFDDVGQARPGHTLNLRATITDIQRTNKALNILSLVAIQAPLSFGGASTRIELTDGASDTVLAEMTLRRRGRTYDVLSSVQSLGHARKSLNRTSKQASKDIQMLRSKFNTVATASARPE